MRVAVLSDTHAGCGQTDLIAQSLKEELKAAEHILHAGDLGCMDMLLALERFAPVTAVAGNMDGFDVHERCPEQTVVELAGARIGLIHGWGAPQDLSRKVFERFTGNDGHCSLDVIVFGHSHQPSIEKRAGVLMVNPGSPTDRRFAPYRSMARLLIGDELHAEIVRLS
jgi:putative phosphoesterase